MNNTELPPLPEPTIEGSVLHEELKICYRAPVHFTADQIHDYARSALASQASKGAVPEGWVPVPVKITEEMHIAAVRAITRATGNDDCPPSVWAAMLAAAPSPAQPAPAPAKKSKCAACGALEGERYRTMSDDQCDAGRHVAQPFPAQGEALSQQVANDLVNEAITIQRKNYGNNIMLHLDMIEWEGKASAAIRALAAKNGEGE